MKIELTPEELEIIIDALWDQNYLVNSKEIIVNEKVARLRRQLIEIINKNSQ